MSRFFPKRISFFFALIASLAILFALLWQPFGPYVLETAIEKAITKVFKGEVSRFSLKKEGARWVSENAELSLFHDQIHVEAKKISWEFIPHLFEGYVSIDLKIDSPKVVGALSKEELLSYFKKKMGKFPIPFRIDWKVSVQDGTWDFSQAERLNFSGDWHLFKDNFLGVGTVFFDLGKGRMTLSSDKGQSSLAFYSVRADLLSSLGKLVYPNLNLFDVKAGVVNGVLSLNQSGIQGDLALLDLHLLSSHGKWEGKFPKLSAHFEPSQEGLGQFTIASGSMIRDADHWFIKDLKGSFLWPNKEKAQFSLTGDVTYLGKEKALKLEGDLVRSQEGEGAISCSLFLTPKGHGGNKSSSIQFSARELGKDWQFIEMDLSELASEEFSLLEKAVFSRIPWTKDFKFHSNHFCASLSLYLHEGEIAEMALQKMVAKDLAISLPKWGLVGSVPQFSGAVTFSFLSEDPFSTLQTDLHAEDAEMTWKGTEGTYASFQKGKLDLIIEEGRFKKADVFGDFLGLSASAHLKNTKKKEGLSIHLEGCFKELLSKLPESFQQGLQAALADDHMICDLEWIPELKNHQLEGAVKLIERNGEETLFNFGCSLSQATLPFSEGGPLDSGNSLLGDYWKGGVLDLLAPMIPPSLWPLSAIHLSLLQKEAGFLGMVIQEGWVSSKSVSLQRFLSPYLFPEKNLQLSGNVQLDGVFDHTMLSVQYRGKEIELISHDLSIEVPEVKEGRHYLDFLRGTHFGKLSVEKGSYFEKNSGLLFADVKTEVLFKEKQIHLENVETFSNGLLFSGGLDLDFSDPNAILVAIKAQGAEGKMANLKQFFAHFNFPSPLVKIPLDGHVSLRGDGGFVTFLFDEKGMDFQVELQGALSEGVARIEGTSALIHDLHFSFDYNHLKKELVFSDVQGLLNLNEKEGMEDYLIGANRFEFSDTQKGEGAFDLWIADQEKKWVHLVGDLKSKEGKLVAQFDQELTHLAGISPELFEFSLENEAIDHLALLLSVPMNTFIDAFKVTLKSDVVKLPPFLNEKIAQVSTGAGELLLKLNYQESSASIQFSLEGKNLKVEEADISQFALKGSKRREMISIQELTLDNMTLASDLLRQEDDWRINFLGVNIGQALLAGIDGTYIPKTGQFSGKINMLEGDFSDLFSSLPKWKVFESFKSDLEGNLKGVGSFAWSLENGLDLFVAASIDHLSTKGMFFSKIDDASFQISKGNIFFKNIHSTLKGPEGLGSILLAVNEGVYTNSGEMEIHDLDFKIQARELKEALKNIESLLGFTVIPEEAKASILALKKEGEHSGKLKMAKKDTELFLTPGTYSIYDQDLYFDKLVLGIYDEEVDIKGECLWGKRPLPLKLSTKKTFKDGNLIIGSTESKNPLTLAWQRNDSGDFAFTRLKGTFEGIKVDFETDVSSPLEENFWKAKGTLLGNPENLLPYLSSPYRDKIESMKIGGSWKIDGVLLAKKHSLEDFTFTGSLLGNLCMLKGYLFEKLEADFIMMPASIELNEVKLSDRAVTAFLPKAFLNYENKWQFYIPKGAVKDFRPSLLREVGSNDETVAKPFIIRSLELENFEGPFEDTSLWKGNGSLSFSNSQRKSQVHPLLVIPQEIINRIGLDLAVLNPVMGTIRFSIAENRLYLNKFKDVYSEGKLSKFNLASEPGEAFIDFSGNLNLQIRMKQYNLLFKLAELFTVTVGGTWEKPTYSLQKQSSGSTTDE